MPLSDMVEDAGEILIRTVWHWNLHTRFACRRAVRRAEHAIAHPDEKLQIGYIERARGAHF
ncbi:hypothetical protein Kisp01_27550 [Kineosporia sp. NBRC 101677]|nr:hypothetical protein Kisp01_27550 [Kineosporia sp. NBRC 101677]